MSLWSSQGNLMDLVKNYLWPCIICRSFYKNRMHCGSCSLWSAKSACHRRKVTVQVLQTLGVAVRDFRQAIFKQNQVKGLGFNLYQPLVTLTGTSKPFPHHQCK